MPQPPPRWKALEDLTADEHARQMAGEQIESPEYRAYVRQVHENAGLALPADAIEPKSLVDMTPEEHFQRLRGR